jgi:hypothetical protein
LAGAQIAGWAAAVATDHGHPRTPVDSPAPHSFATPAGPMWPAAHARWARCYCRCCPRPNSPSATCDGRRHGPQQGGSRAGGGRAGPAGTRFPLVGGDNRNDASTKPAGSI